MIRKCLALAILPLIAACSQSKPVDLTAHYVRDGGEPVTIKAAANGDSRVEAGKRVFLRAGGKEYLVLHDARGDYAATLDDAIAVLGKGTGAPAGPRAQPDYVLSEGGQDNIGGFQGKLWYLHPRDVPSFHAGEAVIATDPTLAAMGKGLAMQARFSISVNSAKMGGAKMDGLGNFEKGMIALFEKGPVLRFGTALRLQRLEKSPIPPAAFTVPPVLTREDFRKRADQMP